MNFPQQCLAAIVLFGMGFNTSGEERPRPVAMFLSSDDNAIWIAHNRPAALVTVDLSTNQLRTGNLPFDALHDLVRENQQSILALVNEPAELVRVDAQSQPPNVVGRWPGLPGGSRLRVSGDGQTLAVASLSQRWVSLIETNELKASSQPRWRKVEIPFAPGELLWLPDHRHLLVADAFADRIGVIDAPSAGIDSVRAIPGHNISGLALDPSGRRVYFTHQSIHRGAQTSEDDIHWGGILTNVLRSIDTADAVNPAADLLQHTDIIHLGDIGRGAGDPAGVAVRADGLLAVSFSGVNEVAFDSGSRLDWKRISVGIRPTRIALTADGRRAVVLNELDDSISLVSLSDPDERPRTIRVSDESPPTAAQRGERLFYDARISHDGWFSCHSCHTNGHSNGQLVDNLTDGTTGTPKRVLSLRGVRDTAPYGWDGHIPQLADQVRHSVTSTMQGRELSENDVHDLVAFLETLSPLPRHTPGDDALARGQGIFEREGCVRCHAGPAYTTPAVYDVGLTDERGKREFNPPSLRGVRHGGPYFHHGRAETLDDVVGRLHHQLRAPLSAAEQADLIAYLRSL